MATLGEASPAARQIMLGDLPDPALETIYYHLSLRERARAELVCKRWLACSRSSALLWGRLEWSQRAAAAEPPEALEWLATRPGVTPREASLHPYSDRAEDILLDCLAAWSPSLRALEFTTGDFLPSSEAWAPNLSGLTQLHLRYRAWSGRDAKFVAGLRSLRTLRWGVCVDEPSEEEIQWLELPAPPQLEHLAVYEPGWRLPAQLAAMTRLQTLDLSMVDIYDLNPALPPSLTWLSYGSLPACLSSLTGLHYLDLSYGQGPGAAPAAQAYLAQALGCLCSLEYLRLERCHLEELPPLSQLRRPLPLRALAIHNNKCTLMDDGWLATLESLTCGWHQLPDPELSAMAPRLQEVALVGQSWCKVAGDVAARGLASMQALPALRVVRFDPDEVEWTEAAKAALEALSQAKPKLESDCQEFYERRSTAWPNPDARFMLGAPA